MKIQPEIYYLIKYFSIENNNENRKSTEENLRQTLVLIDKKVPFLSEKQVRQAFFNHENRILNTFNFYTDFFYNLDLKTSYNKNMYQLKRYIKWPAIIGHIMVHKIRTLRRFSNNHMLGLNSILYSSVEDLKLLHSFNLLKKVHSGFEHHNGYDYMLALITRNRFKEASFICNNGYAELLSKQQILIIFALNLKVNFQMQHMDIWYKFTKESSGKFKHDIMKLMNSVSELDISDTIDCDKFNEYNNYQGSVFYSIHSWDDHYPRLSVQQQKDNLCSFFSIGRAYFENIKLNKMIKITPSEIIHMKRL